MKYEEVSWYSPRLERMMRIKIYGHYGPAIIVFPCQNKQSDDFYNNGMIDTLSDWLEEGKFKLFCLDSVDYDTVSSPSWDKAHAAWILDQYHQYVIFEVLPFIKQCNPGDKDPYVMGISMGGSHSSIAFFRRPELFSGILSLSGQFDVAHFFNGYFNDDVYNNSPAHFLENMDVNHPWIEKYNQKRMIFTCGQGMYEDEVLYSNFWLRDILNKKGINAWYDILGFDCTHDWCSWKPQMRHYLPLLLGWN